MGFSPSELSNQDFLYSFLAEYQDGDLPAELLAKYETELKAHADVGTAAVQFQAMRGRLQLAMQSYYLKEDELTALHALVQDPSAAATEEAVKIERLGRGVAISTLLRRVTLGAIAVGAAGFVYWKVNGGKEQKFKPLDYLGYEAAAMEEDAQQRLNLPTHDPREILQYLNTYPGLDFKPRMLHSVPAPWQADGATVIDYEIAKVVVVMYENPSTRDKLFHFSWAGELSDLPKAEAGNMRGLVYQTYATNELNLVAWQISPGVVSLLVGRRSAPELAEIAVTGSAKR